jgi:hypothetical protein
MQASLNSVEDRLKVLEQAVEELKLQLKTLKRRCPWYEEIAGSFADDQAFEEVIRLGREYREQS